MSDDRPKKSWRERDNAKNRSSHHGRTDEPDQRRQKKTAQSSAYRSYKSNLDKLFTPGVAGAGLPESLKSKLGPTSESAKQRQLLHEALKSTPNTENLAAFLAAEETLPSDARLLTSLLVVTRTDLVQPVLLKLIEVIEEDGKKPNAMLLKQRLDSLEYDNDEPEIVELIGQVRALV